MSDYSEHLISMAGGDGDDLDVEFLMTIIRTQQATIAAVLALANDSGRRGWHVSPDTIRKTLGAS